MKVVVDIPNWLYRAIMEHHEPHYSQSLGDAVRDGMPLPKGHGKLFDERDVYEKIRPHVNNGVLDDIMFSLTPIIIEADKESKVKE